MSEDEAAEDLRAQERADEDALLSRLLLEAREVADQYINLIGEGDPWPIRVRNDIDDYRAGRGWIPRRREM